MKDIDWFSLYNENPEEFKKTRKNFIEENIIRIANGDTQREWILRKIQHNIDKELQQYKDPIARYNAMVVLFWKGFDEFRTTINNT